MTDKEFSGTRHAELVPHVGSATTKRVQPPHLAFGAEMFTLAFSEHECDSPMLDFEAAALCPVQIDMDEHMGERQSRQWALPKIPKIIELLMVFS